MSKTYPYKCQCGVTFDHAVDTINHDCNYWEWVLEEERETNGLHI